MKDETIADVGCVASDVVGAGVSCATAGLVAKKFGTDSVGKQFAAGAAGALTGIAISVGGRLITNKIIDMRMKKKQKKLLAQLLAPPPKNEPLVADANAEATTEAK